MEINDNVEILGLLKKPELNGCWGVIKQKLENGRFKVQLINDKTYLSIQPKNLKITPGNLPYPIVETEDEFVPGDIVEMHGLKSSASKKFNGLTGVVKKKIDGGRYRVMLQNEENDRAFMAKNLKILNDCHNAFYDTSHPVLIWPGVIRSEHTSIQTLTMYPEINEAARGVAD